ncbi:MAG TPA: hypothetical protein VGH19_24265 [Verrucomicrobiae bacterium]
MRKGFFILLAILAIGGLGYSLSGSKKDLYLTEFELDEKSFTADALKKIETETALVLPAGARGLRFHYKPPIDPIVFAKIEMPSGTEDLMEKRLVAMKEFPGKFHVDFANSRCNWWPASFTNEIRSKFSHQGGFYIQAHLVREKDQVVVYIKYFTI